MHHFHRVIRAGRNFNFRRLHPRNLVADTVSQVIWGAGCCLVFACAFSAVACFIAVAVLPAGLLSR